MGEGKDPRGNELHLGVVVVLDIAFEFDVVSRDGAFFFRKFAITGRAGLVIGAIDIDFSRFIGDRHFAIEGIADFDDFGPDAVTRFGFGSVFWSKGDDFRDRFVFRGFYVR